MKLISLNTWGGEAGVEPLLEFFKKHGDVDVFALQEVWNGGEHMLAEKSAGSWLSRRKPTLLKEIQEALPAYCHFYHPHFFDFFGLATFFKKDITVIEESELYIYKEEGFRSETDFGDHSRILHSMTIETGAGPRTIVQLHGIWNGKGKGDSDDRLEQSDRIIRFISELKNPFVIVGDFNLRPDTESIKKLEDFGLRNLIREYGITSTRTSHYTKEEKFADYAFVSEGIDVKDFKVLPDEVSDHAPLYLEFI